MMDELHDIDGVDPASAWPLALGWWLLIGFGLILGAFVVYRMIVMRRWQAESFRYLTRMEKDLTHSNAKETLSTLSEYLRRIALKRYSRDACAGLAGEDWLKWLKEKETGAFDWETKGLILIEIPYAPQDTIASVDQVKELIRAVKGWVQ